MIIGNIENFSIDFVNNNNYSLIYNLPNLHSQYISSQILNSLNEYYKNENVLYFPIDRKLTIDDNKLDKIRIHQCINNLPDNILEDFELEYDCVENLNAYYGKTIHSGYHQLINLFGNIILSKPEQILIIDLIETNLHPLIQGMILRKLYNNKKIKKIIVATNSSYIKDSVKNCFKFLDVCFSRNKLTIK